MGTADFSPVPPNIKDRVTVPKGYRSEVLIKWGDPVTRKARPFDVDRQTAESAATQFGYNNDYVGIIPTGEKRALLVANHEYTNENLMFPTGAYDSATIKRIAMASHGMAVVEIMRGSRKGSWTTVDHRRAKRNRRITAQSMFHMSGPAAGDPRLRTSDDPSGRRVRGTLNNCAGGVTPWGTVLSGEENFNGYFDNSGTIDPRYAASYQRYGITGAGRGWNEVDPRFDLAKEPHEPFRFGWIVELDPMDPTVDPAQAHHAGPVQARGRQRGHRAQRQGRRLHG